MCIYCNRPCQVPTLRWLADNGCPLDQSQSLMCQSAAEAGHLATLQWLVKAGCRWSKLSCLYAAGERVAVLNFSQKYLHVRYMYPVHMYR